MTVDCSLHTTITTTTTSTPNKNVHSDGKEAEITDQHSISKQKKDREKRILKKKMSLRCALANQDQENWQLNNTRRIPSSVAAYTVHATKQNKTPIWKKNECLLATFGFSTAVVSAAVAQTICRKHNDEQNNLWAFIIAHPWTLQLAPTNNANAPCVQWKSIAIFMLTDDGDGTNRLVEEKQKRERELNKTTNR